MPPSKLQILGLRHDGNAVIADGAAQYDGISQTRPIG
jgi:hypothetical protein